MAGFHPPRDWRDLEQFLVDRWNAFGFSLVRHQMDDGGVLLAARIFLNRLRTASSNRQSWKIVDAFRHGADPRPQPAHAIAPRSGVFYWPLRIGRRSTCPSPDWSILRQLLQKSGRILRIITFAGITRPIGGEFVRRLALPPHSSRLVPITQQALVLMSLRFFLSPLFL